MNAELTRDADDLVCVLYAEYLIRRDNGKSRRDAAFFEDAEYIKENFMQEWLIEDITDTCEELENAKLLICQVVAPHIAVEVTLTSGGIIYMENRFSKKSQSLLDRLSSVSGLASAVYAAAKAILG